MLNRLKAIVAKPPTSNKKFHRNTEDVLKSLGRKQKVEEENAFSFQRHFVSSEEEEEEEEEEEGGEGNKTKATKRSRRKIVLQNGDVYEGKWNETSNVPVADETSTYTWKNGDAFMGNCTQILQGKKRPDSGIITYKKDGTIYEYYRKGYGKLVRADGSSYIGNFNERGEFSGFGKFTSAPQKTTKDASASASREACAQHEGLYREGKPNGPGQFRFANGDMYQGEFVDGFFHGWGTIVFNEMGDRYDGEFSRGAFNENGVYTWKNGNCYVGKWKNNKMHGPGAFSDGEEVFILCEYNNGNRIREEKKGELPEALKQHRKRMQDSLKQHNAQSIKLQSSSSMKISKMYKEFGEANLFKKMFSSRSQSVRRVKAGGQTIFKGHRSYELMTQLQLGVVWSISYKNKTTAAVLTADDNRNSMDENDTANEDYKPLTVTDFDTYLKVRFPRIGSEITPPHSSSDFKWKLYSPEVFKRLRRDWGVDESEFMLSICGEQALKEMNSAGKSGSIFFASTDERYIIKTMRKVEMKALLKMLPKYYRHMQENEDSLLTKFFGVFSVKPSQGKKVRFIVMANLFCDSLEIHDTYDLKGSTLGRFTSIETRMKANSLESTTESGVILKDLDLGFKFRLEKSKRDLFIRQVSLDLKLLEELNIMDYSLLVGVHYTNTKDRKSKTGSMLSDSQLSSAGVDTEMPGNHSHTETDGDYDDDVSTLVKNRNNERTSFESSDMYDIDDDDEDAENGDESNPNRKKSEYAWALNIYKQLSKNFGAFETVAATSTKPLVFKYINHGGRRNEEKRPWKGADEQIAQVVGDCVTQFSSNSLPKQLAAVCVPGRSFKSLSEKDMKVLHEEPSVRDAILNLGIIDILQVYSAPKKLERGFKGAVYKATSISVAAPKAYAKRFKDFMRNIFE